MKIKVLLVVLLLMFCATPVLASHPVDVYLFVSENCQYCEKTIYLLGQKQIQDSNLKVHQMEIVHNSENLILFQKFAKTYGVPAGSVPTVFVGDKAIVGAKEDDLLAVVDLCLEKGCKSPQDNVESYLQAEYDKYTPQEKSYKWLWTGIIVLCVIGLGYLFRRTAKRPENQ